MPKNASDGSSGRPLVVLEDLLALPEFGDAEYFAYLVI
jgi:hypothetical protein